MKRSLEPPRWPLFFAASLPALLLYILTLAPTVTPEDSGELITAAYTLGVAHPPGYPLWCLLGKLFTFLPIGSIAYRVNLLSAVLGAAAVGLLAVIAWRFTRSFPLSLIGALSFAATRDFWSQCVVAEVYSLNVLLVVLMLFLVLEFEDTRRRRFLYLAAFTVGLGLTNHSTMGPLAPLFLGWAFIRQPGILLRKIFLLNLAMAFLLGFAIVLYLPMRSAVDPVMDWGDPETLSATWDHLLRRQYSQASEEPTARTAATQVSIIWEFLKTYSAQYTLGVVLVALLGAGVLFRRDLSGSLLLGALFLLTSYGFIWLLNYPPTRENLHLTRVFFLPAYAVTAVWLSVAFLALFTRVRRPFTTRRGLVDALSTGVASVFVLLPLVRHYGENDRSDEYLAYEWGLNILRCLERDAILLPAADHSTFPVIYLQAVEGLRPDVHNGNKYGYIEDRFFREVFEGRDPPRIPPPLGGSRAEKERYLIEHSGRPVYFTTKNDVPGLAGYEIQSHGLVFRVVKSSGAGPDLDAEAKVWKKIRFRAATLHPARREFGRDLILSDYHYARGRRAILEEDYPRALEEFRRSADYGRGIKAIQNNLGGALAEAGKPREAIAFLQKALAIDRDYEIAVRNVANAFLAMGEYREGAGWFRKALSLDPQNLGLRLGITRAYRDGGWSDQARGSYERLLDDDPRNRALQTEYEEFILSVYGETELERVKLARAAREKELKELFARSARQGSSESHEGLDGAYDPFTGAGVPGLLYGRQSAPGISATPLVPHDATPTLPE